MTTTPEPTIDTLPLISEEHPVGQSHPAPATKPSGVRRVVQVFFSALSLILLSIVALTAAVAIVIPATTGSSTFTILTRSMEPGMPPGTMIVTRTADPAELVVGDVITYQLRSGEPEVVTHRIVRVIHSSDGHRSFILRGDNNATDDAKPVREVQIRGKVWYAIPLIGNVAVNTGSHGRVLIVGAGATALFGYAAVHLVIWARDTRRRRR